jgi:hypothetical protein
MVQLSVIPWTSSSRLLQARLHMPACWDGKNLDSANHFDHVCVFVLALLVMCSAISTGCLPQRS